MTSVRHVIWSLAMGGAEMALRRLVAATEDELPQQTICVVRPGGSLRGEFSALRTPVVGLGANPLGMLRGRMSRRGRSGPDAPNRIVQGWMYYGNLLALCVAAGRGMHQSKVIWNIRHSLSWLEHEKRRTSAAIRIGAALSLRADAIVYNSTVAARQHEAYGFAASRTIVIPNGIDCERYRPSSLAGAKLRSRFQIVGDMPIIGLVARFHPIKGHALLIQALAKLAASGRRAHLLLIGPGVDGRNEALRMVVDKVGMWPHVTLAGERRDVPELLPGLDIACLASYGEAWPNFLGEAMASGVPCVATDVGDAREIVGDCGRIVGPGDADALAQGLASLLDAPIDERRALGRAARNRIQQYYGIDTVAQRYLALYEAVCKPGWPERGGPSDCQKGQVPWRVS